MSKKFTNVTAIRSLIVLLSIAAASILPGTLLALDWGPSGLTNPNADRPFMRVEADPTNPAIVWALTAHIPYPNPDYTVKAAKGIFRSTDKGLTWEQKNDTLLTPDIPVYDIAIDPNNSDVVYLGTNTLGILKSTDGGSSWETANNGISYQGAQFPDVRWGVDAIEINPHDPQVIYAGILQAYAVELDQGAGEHPGLYKTTDGGANWVERNDGLPSRSDPFTMFDLVSHTSTVWSIRILDQNPEIVLVGLADFEANANLAGDKTARSRGRVFYSLHGGENGWAEASDGLPLIEESRNDPFVLARMSASFINLAKNTGSGLIFTATHTGAKSIAIIYPQLDTDTVTKCAGIFRKNRYAPWVAVNTGLPVANDEENDNSINTNHVTVSPVNPDIMIVGVFDADSGDPGSDASKVYLSVDRGDHWTGTWSGGLSVSPSQFAEASPFFVDINANQTAAYASVRWDFDPVFFYVGGTVDDGIYRLPPFPPGP